MKDDWAHRAFFRWHVGLYCNASVKINKSYWKVSSLLVKLIEDMANNMETNGNPEVALKKFPIQCTLTIKYDSLPNLSQDFILKALPKEVKPNQNAVVGNGSNNSVPAQRQPKFYGMHKDHLMYISIEKKPIETEEEYFSLYPVQTIAVLCDCSGEVGDSGLCPRVKAMGLVTYESSDDEEDETSR